MFAGSRGITWRNGERSYLEYLSSGEKRAGWADFEISPSQVFLRV